MLVGSMASLGPTYYKTQGYWSPSLAGPKSILGPAQPMNLDYFGLCSCKTQG
jgi:hypothetical protein